jgi:hypothetical protein
MLSTSNKTKFQYPYLLVAIVILAMVSVIALYQSGVMPSIPVGKLGSQNLTVLNSANASAYSWDAKFYTGQASPALNLNWPARPDFSILNQQAIIPETGSADGLAVYHSSERGTFAAAQNGMSIYHQSERNAAQEPAFHYTPPGR